MYLEGLVEPSRQTSANVNCYIPKINVYYEVEDFYISNMYKYQCTLTNYYLLQRK